MHGHGPGQSPAGRGDGGGGDRGGQRQDAPEHDVLKDGGPQHETGETGVQYPQVIEDLGDDGDRGDSRRDGKHQDDGGFAPRVSHERLQGQHRGHEQRKEEGQWGAQAEDPRGRLPVLLAQHVPHARAGDKHEQQKPQVVQEAQDHRGRILPTVPEDMCGGVGRQQSK